MSDRTDWDAWDFGEPDDEGSWDEPTVAGDEPRWVAEPTADDGGGWGPAAPGGPPRGALLAALAMMLVLAVGIAAVVLHDDDDDGGDADEAASEVDTDDERSSTSSSSTSSSTTLVGGTEGSGPDVEGGSSTTRPRGSTSTTQRASTTSTAPEDTDDPACASGGGGAATPVPDDWATRWQTMPRPNDPARVSICIDDKTPKVGQRVTVTIRGDDPDAVIVQQDCGYLVEWEGTGPNLCRDGLAPPPDGPRPTPPQEPGHVIVELTHVYGAPGGRTIVGTVRSSRWEGYETPYASFARADLPIIVHA